MTFDVLAELTRARADLETALIAVRDAQAAGTIEVQDSLLDSAQRCAGNAVNAVQRAREALRKR